VPEDGVFGVRKVLDADDVQGNRDMSGFEFEVRSAANDVVARLVTGADGHTPLMAAQPGSYTIAEVARPTWAAALVDQGPITFDLAPGVDAEPHVIDYLNVIPDATITTSARDARDGDRLVDLDAGAATIVDSVTHTALLPGTEYVASGELMVRPTDGADGDTSMVPTGIIGSITFVPDTPDGTVEVSFDIPADSPLHSHVVVVYQRLSIAASGRVVAVHTDRDAAEQTIRFADVTPTTTTTTTTSTVAPATTAAPSATTTTTAAAAPATSTSPPPTPSSSPPPPSPAPATSTPPALPRTGNSGLQATALAGIVLVVLGLALLATVGRRRPPRSTTGST
jgi:LPXTG-motif cell wall-anchored protein